MCSEFTPRAPIPDTRIPQLMQPWGLTDFLQYQKGGLQQQTKKRDSDLWDFKRIHHLIVAASIISLWATRSIFSLLQKKPKSNDFLLFKNLIFSKKPKSNDFFFKFNFFWRFRALFNQLKAPHTRCFSLVYMRIIFVGRDGRLDETFAFFLGFSSWT